MIYETKLKNLVSPSFYELWHDIRKNRHTHYWLKGGRGSTKSSFISLFLILGMMRDHNANAVVLRKVARYLRDSVCEQLLWAIDKLRVADLWQYRTTPLQLIYKPTGQKILFRGADNPQKLKSIKFSNGFCKYIWFEEVDEFRGGENVRNILQSLLRGGQDYKVFYSYNPPRSVRSWVNAEALVQRDDKFVHHSTYLDVPKTWLGEQFLLEAEYLRRVNEPSYRHEYLGEVTGTGGEIFTNVTVRRIGEEEIAGFDRVQRGLDWGFARDPLHYTVNHYARGRLYIFYELHKAGMATGAVAEAIKRENKDNCVVIADSAEPRSNDALKRYGLKVAKSKKGPDSVRYGIKWLQDLEEIIIDPERCPNTVREFLEYEYEQDDKGNFRDDYPDRNNHAIDAVRYSREFDIRQNQMRVLMPRK